MIDFEATLLKMYIDNDAMRKLIDCGLKDENVEILGEDALNVWVTARQWYQKKNKAVEEAWLITKHESYIRTTRESGDALDDPEPSEIVKALKTRYLQKRYKARIEEETFDLKDSPEASQVKALNLARDLLKIAMASAPERPLEPMSENLERFVKENLEYNSLLEEGLLRKPVTFGFQKVDDLYQGIMPGEVVVLAAYLKVGKSFVAAKQALAAAESGRKVALWTLENSEHETYARLVALKAGLSYIDINQHSLGQEQREKFKELVGKDVFERLYVKRPVTMEASSLEEIYWQSKDVGAELVIGDQLSHVYYPGEKKSDPDWLNEHKKMLTISALSKETDMASIWVHQLNRGAHNKADPGANDLARSLGIGQAADFVFYLSDPTKGTGTVRKLACSTVRRGPTCKWELIFNFSPMQVEATRVWDD